MSKTLRQFGQFPEWNDYDAHDGDYLANGDSLYVVTFTSTTGQDDSCDRTYQEVVQALNDGKRVVATYNSSSFGVSFVPVMLNTKDNMIFASGVAKSTSWVAICCTITSDDTVIVDVAVLSTAN